MLILNVIVIQENHKGIVNTLSLHLQAITCYVFPEINKELPSIESNHNTGNEEVFNKCIVIISFSNKIALKESICKNTCLWLLRLHKNKTSTRPITELGTKRNEKTIDL